MLMETKVDSDMLKPMLKWAGGKRWLVPYIEPLWRNHSDMRLVEPFCGGLAVTLSLNPETALINDINPHLINFYQWVKNGLVISLPMRNEKELYYEYRSRFNDLVTSGGSGSQESAELFYYLNRTGFNGLCRFNKKGKFNVPFGRYKTINYMQDFGAYKQVFQKWDLSCSDFEQLKLSSNDFVYADPPYDVEFTQYAQDDFKWEDQVRLAEWLAGHKGPVVLSNQATDRILSLYGDLGYNIELFDAPRRISCTGDRTPAKEVLATKNI